MKADVVVIGGGAAGMLCAALTARRGFEVLLLDRNDRLGRKLLITGKGRCNVTNNCPVRQALDNIPTGGKFLQSAMNGFTPQDTMALFEQLGVPLKTERGGRVFPVSDKSADIVSALNRFVQKTGVVVRKERVTGIGTSEGRVTSVKTDREEILCRAAILCTGGASYPATGSTGDGYAIAAALGHRIVPPKPSLVPLRAAPEICSRLQGLTLKNVGLTVRNGGKKPVYEDFGELLFTHFGVSGPMILSASAHMRDFNNNQYELVIDLKPALDEKALDARLLRDFDKYANRDFINALSELAPKTLIPVLVDLSEIPPDTKVNSVTKAQRQRLLELFKNFRLPVDGPRPIEEAIITSGGVELKEINPTTMASRLVDGLYFAGEVIDADAYTGGFNLQIAWSTAYAAAMHLEL